MGGLTGERVGKAELNYWGEPERTPHLYIYIRAVRPVSNLAPRRVP